MMEADAAMMEADAYLVWEHYTPRRAYGEAEAFVIGYRVGRLRRHVYAALVRMQERAALAPWLSLYVA